MKYSLASKQCNYFHCTSINIRHVFIYSYRELCGLIIGVAAISTIEIGLLPKLLSFFFYFLFLDVVFIFSCSNLLKT